MKIAYLLNWELSSQDGVSKKVYSQTHEWQALNNEVQIFCIAKTRFTEFGSVPFQVIEKGDYNNIIGEFNNIYKAYCRALSLIVDSDPDIIYFRFDIYQPALKKIFRAFPTIIEMNSNDKEELRLLAKKGLKGKLRYVYHRLVRNQYLGSVEGFCCVTHEIANLASIRKFNKPVFVVPNAISLGHYPEAAADRFSNTLPNLVFIGTPNQSWHGVDKILDLAKATEGKLCSHLVGINQNGLQGNYSNIKFYGYLQKSDYHNILLQADIGVCTLALHRKNMEEACPLKTREYLAYGLPIIIGYQDTAFSGAEMPDWILQLPNTENNVCSNIDKILAFCYQHFGKKLKKEETENFIDSFVLEQLRLQQLSNIVNEKSITG